MSTISKEFVYLYNYFRFELYLMMAENGSTKLDLPYQCRFVDHYLLFLFMSKQI